ncbi:MAG: NADP-dependent isocitrate dehydrogenase [Spirochaetaceae bacterium]|jgi:isocitrate dehydrogenase|nr:NADP-dependent isocitrate dehydrogenase [Spirochaetaceae bacterium]
MEKIGMKTPLVEMDGDEMTRVLWELVKKNLILPFVDLKTEYYDLCVQNRDATCDAVTVEAARAILRHRVGVKCATITTNAERKKEYGLKSIFPSPNATIRGILDGTVFRKPITARNIKPSVITWERPIVIGRHAYGDIYRNAEMSVDAPGKVELVYTGNDGSERRVLVADMKEGGVVQGVHNYDASIRSFARSCFRYALDEALPVMFAAKDTISQVYDARFRDIFSHVYETEYKAEFAEKKIDYMYALIDDAVARVVKSAGGFLWACKNYDGDVMSDMIASATGSLAMMTSVLLSPDGCYEYEAAHGTVRKHYCRYRNGEKPGTNPIALIFAWAGALEKRAELDGIPELAEFARQLQAAALQTIEGGLMTGDLAALLPSGATPLNSWDFIDEVALRLARFRQV